MHSVYFDKNWVDAELEKTFYLAVEKLKEINKNEACSLSSQDIDNMKDLVKILHYFKK